MTYKIKQDYFNMTDEDIVYYAREKDVKAQDFIINKYKKLVKLKSNDYFILGADKEDIVQEGMIGLYKAIRDFDKNKNVKFNTFADLCITRQILTAIKSANRKKHSPLNSYLSLNKNIYNEETIIDNFLKDTIHNPEDLFIDNEEKTYIEENMFKHLSDLELKVLNLHLLGNTYLEIANIVSKDEKSIDNALQRIRKKVEKIIAEKNLKNFKNYVKV